ncbi:helix-turn-helix domain-containing protein [Acidovorax sp. GBBC 3334]|uniref:transcriptional regulator n=1 Tax=unclassified Acidovorax TaxID=2684926 RepID=UPI002303EDF7|nr:MULTISPECIES: YdaS family helix-turn-helix protein [unclassified Acidovorax]MDA8456024.1 helix-turn-helix domain-containing protein [Acidovorax sp. GBBC 3334]MDA8523656.1 helix-turn-helix domain-containing protein [Acidovorax sp. NCPPB 4044]
MTLDEYLQLHDALSVRQLRMRMAQHGSPIKSDAQIRQWQHRYAQRIPSPINCVAIEQATDGRVTRQDLRPHDWASIWPELGTLR